MGIFDFLKSSENKNKNKENNVDNEIKINNHQINKEIPDKNININVNKSSNNDSEPIENNIWKRIQNAQKGLAWKKIISINKKILE